MSLLRYCTLGALLLHLASGAGQWGYSPGPNGPENWKSVAPQFCSGRAQSPIDLVYRSTVKTTYPAFTFTGYNAVTGNVNFTMSNNGHAVGVAFDDNNAHRIGGGGLPGNNYKLAQFHFHWSFLDNLGAGSEHVVNGQIYPAELHLVHWNADQHSDLGDAAVGNSTNHASLAVLGWFLELCNTDNPAFEPMLKYIANVSQSGTEFKLPSAGRFNLDSLLPTDRTKFFRYNGSLTTPTCNEVVTWTVFKDTISISRNQLTKFINSVYYKAAANTAAKKMQGNYRPPQALNGRTVYRSFDDATLNVTPRPTPKRAPGSQAQSGLGLKVTQKEVRTILGEPAVLPASYNTRYKILSLTWSKVTDKNTRTVVFFYSPPSAVRKAYESYEGRADLADHASLRINPTKPGDGGTYVLMVMSEELGGQEDSVHLTLMVPPVVEVGPANPYAVEWGKSVTLTCTVRNAKPNITSLGWFKDGIPIERTSGMDMKYNTGTANAPFLTINKVTRADAGTYRCAVEHVVQRTGAELRLDVLYRASIISISKSQTAWVSDDVTLQCVADGNPPPNITWTRGGLVMPSHIHRLSNDVRACSVTVRNIQTNDTGTYLCTADNGVKESDIKSVDLSVKARRRGTPSSTLAIIVGATAGALWLIICVGLCVYILLRRRKEKEKKKFAFYYNMGRRDPPAGSSPKRDEDGEPPPYAALPAKPVGSKAARAGINTMRRTAELKAGRRYAKVLYTYIPREENELPLEVDDIIEVLEGEDGGWCLGYLRGRIGLFPSNYVKFIAERKVPALRQAVELEERQMKRSV